MTAAQIVVTATAAAVVASIVLVCLGVGLLAGVAWSLIAAGALAGPTSVGAAVALLRDDGIRSP